ncbi:MAG: TonB-dependent receptor plug domain-containing protein, partial [Bacteroidia bacterium]
GKQTVLVSCIGYETLKQVIEIPENGNSPITFVLKSKNIQLREVAIEANDIGQSMSAINRIDVQLRPTNSSQDLLTLVPGLFIAQHAGGGKAEQIFLRGFDVDHGTDFFVSVDGMPVNMVSHAHGQGYADFHFVIPETVERLNAVKGPYNARFGDFTTSGAGEFFTKNALDKNLIRFGAGDFNTWRGLAMIDLLRGKHLLSKSTEHAYIAAEYNYSDAFFDMPQHFSRLNVFAKYTGQINEKNILSFSASTFSSRWNASGQIPDRAVKQGLISRFGSISNSEGGSTGRNNVNVSLLTNLGNNQTMKHQVYYSFYRFGLFSDFTFFLNDSINGDEIYQQEKGRHIYGYTGSYERINYIGNKKLVSTLGIASRLDMAELGLYRSQNRVLGDTTVSGNLFQQSVSSWLDETLELTEHIKMN